MTLINRRKYSDPFISDQTGQTDQIDEIDQNETRTDYYVLHTKFWQLDGDFQDSRGLTRRNNADTFPRFKVEEV